MSDQLVLFEKQDNIAIITLNRPPMNPLNTQLLRDFEKLIEDSIESDSSIKAVIVTGSGEKAFAAGADVNEVLENTPLEQYAYLRLIHSAFQKIEDIDRPTIAAVNGLALGGGCELTLACDFRLASENAKFSFPEINIGVIPGGGGTQRLPRIIGLGKAKELLFMGDTITASEAEKLGLVNKVVSESELNEKSMELAEKLAKKPEVAIKVLKNTVNKGTQMDLGSALDFEITSFLIPFSTEDRVEGIKALLEKRKPNFSGK